MSRQNVFLSYNFSSLGSTPLKPKETIRATAERMKIWIPYFEMLAQSLGATPVDPDDAYVIDIGKLAKNYLPEEKVSSILKYAWNTDSRNRSTLAHVVAEEVLANLDQALERIPEKERANVKEAVRQFSRPDSFYDTKEILAGVIMMPNPEFNKICARHTSDTTYYLSGCFRVPLDMAETRQRHNPSLHQVKVDQPAATAFALKAVL